MSLILKRGNDNDANLRLAEQSVLGAALMQPNVIPEITAHVNTGSFQNPRHILIWEAITAQHDEGLPVDALTITARLLDEGNLKKVGGGNYLHDLVAGVPTAANGGYYARKVADAAKRREMEAAAIRLGQLAKDGKHRDLTEVLALSRDTLDAIGTTGDGWADPIPLIDAANLPAFPTSALPTWVGDMADGVAEATQTPADLAGAMALAALSTAVQGKIKVQVKSGWVEQCNLFVCVALNPGNRKTGVFDAMVRYPLLEVERDLAEELKPRIIESRTEADILTRAAEAARIHAAKNASDPDAVNEAKRAALEAEQFEVPHEPKLFADDVTPEIVKTLMARHGGAMAVLSDEGGLFQTIAGRYSGVPDLDVFLKGHSGGMIRVERKSSASEHIDSAALTIGLSPQPAVLRDAAGMPGFEERGLLARFLFAMPESRVGSRKHNPDPVPGKVEREYARRIAALVHSAHMTSEATVIELTPAARDRVMELERDREPRLAPGGEWESILAWANKWTGQIVRIAGLLHIAEHGFVGRYDPIEADTIDAATMIGYYYADHARAVWDYMGASTETGPAKMLLEWLARNAKPGMSSTDIHRGVRGRTVLKSAAEVRGALDLLEDHGWARRRLAPTTSRKGGRPPAPRYDFHPQLNAGTGGLA
ncbi:DUF3987 domain-containing protein [Glycomyces sp. NPDC049804]|uniref:DUF3987 domain-containing protein n=1 Tax=Glycomyces sp. NPDC049804 TaxID=3154363 RepID=UPI003445C515